MKWMMLTICLLIAFIVIHDLITADCWKSARKELISYTTGSDK